MTETFGQRLKRLREAKGWTTRQVSDSVRENEPLLINLENGTSLPQFQKSVDMYRLAEALDVTMDYLYSGVEPSDGEQCEMIPTLDGLTVDETILYCELEILRIEIKSLRRMVRLGKAAKAKREWDGIVAVQINRVDNHFGGVK